TFCSQDPGALRQEDRLSVCSKLCYAIGGAPNQVATSATAFFLQIYLLDIAHITPFHASLVLFIGKAWGAVTDPVAGFFISKSKWTKIGRLMPWMLGCTPFTIVSYFFMWYLPPFVAGRVVWYLTFYCLFQALTTLFQVPYSALTMFLSPDQKERDSATAYRMTVEVLGTLMGAALHGQIVASAHASDHGKLNSNTSGFQTIPFFKGLRLTMKHGPYLKLTASFLLISTAVQLEQSNFVLFCTHAASLHNHFQYLVVTILVSCTETNGIFWGEDPFQLQHRPQNSLEQLLLPYGQISIYEHPNQSAEKAPTNNLVLLGYMTS
uniref:Major facilitator superfamily domain containing 2B n=1 Tax=Gopherus agassizii TaxID=38772 RepID=A0A452HU68_9SAUR